MQAAINENCRWTVPELVSEILTEYLGMNRVAAKFVPLLLSQERKKFRAEVAQDSLETSDSDPHFLKQVITSNKSWVYGYDPETKA
jgi:histone-lysine N-methyltransferase SETMAR